MRSLRVSDVWLSVTHRFRNYRRMTKVLFGCTATVITICVIATLITSLLAENSTEPSYGTEYVNYSNTRQQGKEYEKQSDTFTPKEPTLILVQAIFRHGDRSPIRSYPTDPHKNGWPQGYGQLTKSGRMQGLQLGQFLRNHYSGFLGDVYKPEEVYIRSTNKDRCIMTAQCVAAGLFPDETGAVEDWPFGNWQPIPVHTMPQEWDKMLRPARACSYVKDLSYGLKAYFYSQQKLMKDKVMMFALSEYSGLEMNFTTLYYLADTIYCEKIHNMTRPNWMKKDMEDELISFYHRLPELTPEETKYLGGILLDTLMENMLSKAHNVSDKHKLYLYSAHHSNLHSLMSLLEVFDQDLVIPFGSAFVLELHSISHKPFVKLLYKIPNKSEPTILHLPGCKNDLCPLSVLTDLFDESSHKSWEEVCGNAGTENVIDFGENTIPILVAVLVAFIGLDFFLLYKTCTYRQKLHKGERKEEYSLVRTDGGSSDSEDDLEIVNKEHQHKSSNHVRNGGNKIKANKSNHTVNRKHYDIEHKDDDGYKETSLFIAPVSKTS